MVTRRGSGAAGVAAAALVAPSGFNGLAAGAGGYGHGAGGDWLYQLVFTLFARGLACAALGLATACSLSGCAWLCSGTETCRSLMTVFTPAARPASSAAAMRSRSLATRPVSVTVPSFDATAICLLCILGSAKKRLCTSVTMRASSGGEDFEQPKVRINPTRINGTNQIFFCIADTPMRAFLSFERQGHGFLQGIFGGTRLVEATQSRLSVRPSGAANSAAP